MPFDWCNVSSTAQKGNGNAAHAAAQPQINRRQLPPLSESRIRDSDTMRTTPHSPSSRVGRRVAATPVRILASSGTLIVRRRRTSFVYDAKARSIGIVRSSSIASPPVATSPASAAAAALEGDGKQSTAYPFPEIEARWQNYWLENKTFRTPEVVDTSKPKYYVLDMFPYPRWA